MIRAVIFDFDGVIANSEPLHFAAFRDVLAADGVALSQFDYYERYLGYDDVGVFRAVSRERELDWDDRRVAALVDRKAVRLEALERDDAILFPGAEQAIRRLAAALPLAIASGALRLEIERVLNRTGLAHYFGAIVAAEDTPVSKPAPDPYVRAVDRLSAASGLRLVPADCVAVEDSHWGLESARAAGLRTIAITHTYPASALGAADLLIDHLDRLTLATLLSIDPS
ncbi:MAG: HAD family phosphatase [Acidobacteriota bacterium]